MNRYDLALGKKVETFSPGILFQIEFCCASEMVAKYPCSPKITDTALKVTIGVGITFDRIIIWFQDSPVWDKTLPKGPMTANAGTELEFKLDQRLQSILCEALKI